MLEVRFWRYLRKLLGEMDDINIIDTERVKYPHLLGHRGKIPGKLRFAKHFARMRIKGHDRRWHAESLSLLDGPSDHFLVPEMNAVKITDCDDLSDCRNKLRIRKWVFHFSDFHKHPSLS
jgi:hypothetical protein